MELEAVASNRVPSAEKHPINLIAYWGYVFLFGLLLAPIVLWAASTQGPSVLATAAVVTAIVFTGLSAYVIMFAKDLGRTIDYLATRPEIDGGRIAFFGFSRGASLAPVMLTHEPRIKVAALWIPGFYLETMAPEVDPVNFVSHMTIPVLQLSGRYDYNFPDETTSLPFFNMLAAPVEQKRRVVYDTGHNLPANEAIRETLDWFDKYLGPPQ